MRELAEYEKEIKAFLETKGFTIDSIKLEQEHIVYDLTPEEFFILFGNSQGPLKKLVLNLRAHHLYQNNLSRNTCE